MDPMLKEKGIESPEKVYEAIKNCQDPVVKHMLIWSLSLQRTWGAFQVATGAGLWCVIFMLPIEHRAPVHRMHRLGRSGEIDDRKAAMAEADARGGPHAEPVGSAMGDRVAHPLNPVRFDRLGRAAMKDTGDPAHGARS